MIRNRYENLSRKSSAEAADIVCKVEKRNYLAHSIREIESALSRSPYFRHYRIITHVPSTQNEDSLIFFRNNCCEIFLPSECENMNDKKIRFALGHELGHLVYNLDRLDDKDVLDNKKPSIEEEIFAWGFAYYLIKLKSKHHERFKKSTDFIYGDEELKRAISDIVKEKNEEIYDDLMRSLSVN